MFFLLQEPLHFTGFSVAGCGEDGAASLEEVNRSKLNEPNARNSSSMAERFIMA
jgi:hypothetical protein